MPKLYNILIADDDDDDQFIIREALEEIVTDSLSISTVSDGAQLLEHLKRQATSATLPDLILLDINMPIVNGLEALEKMRNEEKWKHIPVFILSTLRTADRVDRSRQLGALNYYSKPNHLAGYKKVLTEMLDQTLYQA